jgi:Sodium/calcium exchanger protein
MAEPEEVPTAPWWVWTLLILLAAASFWCQACVTEERCASAVVTDPNLHSICRDQIPLTPAFVPCLDSFRLVPALNVIADHYKISSDIAGATLMAAGASSPELFSSFVALFITHSSLGLGTIVGSEIFNQLIICAGSVFASKTGNLALDRVIVTREVSFYALGIVVLYFALQDSRPLDTDPDGPNYIFISFWQSCMVFGGYILYVLVCANMDALVSCMSMTTKSIGERLTLAPAANYGSTKKMVGAIQ